VLDLCVVFLGAVFSGIWLVFIGWFVIASATAESGQATLQVLLRGVAVCEAMTANPLVAAADTTVAGFLADPALRHRHSAFPSRQNAVGCRPHLGCLRSGADRRPRLWPRSEVARCMEGFAPKAVVRHDAGRGC
jgi:hypothetical protein